MVKKEIGSGALRVPTTGDPVLLAFLNELLKQFNTTLVVKNLEVKGSFDQININTLFSGIIPQLGQDIDQIHSRLQKLESKVFK